MSTKGRTNIITMKTYLQEIGKYESYITWMKQKRAEYFKLSDNERQKRKREKMKQITEKKNEYIKETVINLYKRGISEIGIFDKIEGVKMGTIRRIIKEFRKSLNF